MPEKNLKEQIDETRVIETVTRHLPCKLNDDELRVFGDDLAQSALDIEAEEENQKTVKEQLKSRLSGLKTKFNKLVRIVSRREEYRDIEVIIELLAGGIVRETRTDTDEILMTRPAKPEEKQFRF